MEGLRIGCHSNSYACEGRGANTFGNILQLLAFVNSGFLLFLDCIIVTGCHLAHCCKNRYPWDVWRLIWVNKYHNWPDKHSSGSAITHDDDIVIEYLTNLKKGYDNLITATNASIVASQIWGGKKRKRGTLSALAMY